MSVAYNETEFLATYSYSSYMAIYRYVYLHDYINTCWLRLLYYYTAANQLLTDA